MLFGNQVFSFSYLISLCLCLTLPGRAKTRGSRQSIISPDWNFEKMGIGGLDKEFSDIFRRAFASRVFPPDIVEQMGEFYSVCPNIIYSFVCIYSSTFFTTWLQLRTWFQKSVEVLILTFSCTTSVKVSLKCVCLGMCHFNLSPTVSL